ncbi:MAG: 16S rRNA (guanine(527)-N(7))-methyltransferase RsmG [Halomonadaceae bacterium]|nr:MAG: 16S rRNA (guanine(527)-N(7))-methyltransferase RsmG [Halomonadaceae bacterium]
MDEHQQLLDGAQQLGVPVTPDQARQLTAFLDLLQKWNKAYNLTAVRDRQGMLYRHLLDSLSLAPFIHSDRVLDVGAGGGLPGVVLALLYPQRQFTLLDGNHKKSRFLIQCRIELGLTNLQAVTARAQDFIPDAPYPQISSRAFTALANLVDWCGHLLAPGGEFLAMKGQYPAEELAALPPGWTLHSCQAIKVPGCEGDRHILRLQRS